jgi:hypothetical protein
MEKIKSRTEINEIAKKTEEKKSMKQKVGSSKG